MLERITNGGTGLVLPASDRYSVVEQLGEIMALPSGKRLVSDVVDELEKHHQQIKIYRQPRARQRFDVKKPKGPDDRPNPFIFLGTDPIPVTDSHGEGFVLPEHLGFAHELVHARHFLRNPELYGPMYVNANADWTSWEERVTIAGIDGETAQALSESLGGRFDVDGLSDYGAISEHQLCTEAGVPLRKRYEAPRPDRGSSPV